MVKHWIHEAWETPANVELDQLVNRAVAEVKAQRRARAWDKYNALRMSERKLAEWLYDKGFSPADEVTELLAHLLCNRDEIVGHKLYRTCFDLECRIVGYLEAEHDAK